MSYLKPKDILDMVYSSFPRISVKARGIVLQDGSYYRLTDEDVRIDLLDLKEDIPSGAEVEVEGVLAYNPYMQGGGVYTRIKVREIKVINQDKAEETSLLLTLENKLRNKKHMGFWGSYIQSILERGSGLQIAVLHGRGSQVHRDFEQALNSSVGPYKNLVRIIFHETPLSDDILSSALLKFKGFHMVFLLRGGGAKEELQRVGGVKSAMVVLEHHIPLYLALGHSLDKSLSLMEKVAEYSFATPSIAGAELGKAIRQTADLLYLLREREHLLLRAKQAEDKIKEMQNQINPIPILFALLAGGAIGFLLKTLL